MEVTALVFDHQTLWKNLYWEEKYAFLLVSDRRSFQGFVEGTTVYETFFDYLSIVPAVEISFDHY